MTIYFWNKHGGTHYKRHLEKFARINGIALTNRKMLDISRIESDTSSTSTNESKNISTKQSGAYTSNDPDGKIWPNPIIVNNIAIGQNLPNIKYIINLNNNANPELKNQISMILAKIKQATAIRENTKETNPLAERTLQAF